jgi:beta-lactamase regulating signal transducer with metallopeptidase domain/tetratricopeptide (TPR) repeat protein
MNTLMEMLNTWGTRFAGFALPMLAQSAALIAVLYALDRLLRYRVRATVRYALWMLLLVKLVLPPTLVSPTSPAYWLPHSATGERMLYEAGVPNLIPPPVPFGASRPVGQAEVRSATVAPLSRPAVLLLVWMIAVATLAVWIAWRIRAVARILREATNAPPFVRDLLDSCRAQLGIKRAIRIRQSAVVGSPAICGFFRPVVLLPEALAGQLSEPELRAVLLHELAHFRRGDLWVGHAQILLQLIYWYNPLVWFANRAIQRVREQAVDEMVLVEMKEDAGQYPETLLQVARFALSRPALSLGFLGILEPSGGLKERILHILHRPHPTMARVGIRGLLLATVLALVAVPMGCRKNVPSSAPPSPPAPNILSSLLKLVRRAGLPPEMQGNSLTEDQVGGLEAQLARNPEKVKVREELLGFYLTHRAGSFQAVRQQHVLWMIEHRPDSTIQPPFVSMHRVQDGAVYDQAKALWLKQVQDHPKNTAILGNAAAFLLIEDRPGAETLLKEAQAIEPGNARWSEALAQLYALNAHTGDTASASNAVEQLEKIHNANPRGDYTHLGDLAMMSLAAGDLEKARSYASDILKGASANTANSYYVLNIHHANMVLGRIAVREGKLDDAKKYLLDAGKIPGYPSLNTFGPNMALAKDLLEKGDQATVLAYFQECGVFWTMSGGPDKLKQWSAEVSDGKIPNFGANLIY